MNVMYICKYIYSWQANLEEKQQNQTKLKLDNNNNNQPEWLLLLSIWYNEISEQIFTQRMCTDLEWNFFLSIQQSWKSWEKTLSCNQFMQIHSDYCVLIKNLLFWEAWANLAVAKIQIKVLHYENQWKKW